jgi:hypothetical protein
LPCVYSVEGSYTLKYFTTVPNTIRQFDHGCARVARRFCAAVRWWSDV